MGFLVLKVVHDDGERGHHIHGRGAKTGPRMARNGAQGRGGEEGKENTQRIRKGERVRIRFNQEKIKIKRGAL